MLAGEREKENDHEDSRCIFGGSRAAFVFCNGGSSRLVAQWYLGWPQWPREQAQINLHDLLSRKVRRVMTKSVFMVSSFLAVTFITPALALELKGQSTISWGGKSSVHRFVTSVDPETRSFVRSGDIELASGRKASYRIEGSCTAAFTCSWTGSGKGPMGGSWTGSGNLTRPEPGKAVMSGKVTAPTGEVIEFTREVDGDLVKALAALKLQ
jgi:hypothetical protein